MTSTVIRVNQLLTCPCRRTSLQMVLTQDYPDDPANTKEPLLPSIHGLKCNLCGGAVAHQT